MLNTVLSFCLRVQNPCHCVFEDIYACGTYAERVYNVLCLFLVILFLFTRCTETKNLKGPIDAH